MNRQFDLLGIGALAVDDLIYLDRFPIRGEKMRVQSRRRELGGLTANALVAASRFQSKTAWCGVLGNDDLSRFSLSQLEANGVDVSRVHQQEAQPRHSTIIVDNSNGERTILSSNDHVTNFPVEAVTEELIRSCRVLFVDHTSGEAGRKAAQIARDLRIPVVADIERIDEPGIRETMGDVDHLIVGSRFARALTEKSAPREVLEAMRAHMSTHAASVCVVTDGENGCWYWANEEARHVAAFAVETRDTTGCGDVFHGVYSALLAQGEDEENGIVMASAAAALKATKIGGGSGAPRREEVETFLKRFGLRLGSD